MPILAQARPLLRPEGVREAADERPTDGRAKPNAGHSSPHLSRNGLRRRKHRPGSAGASRQPLHHRHARRLDRPRVTALRHLHAVSVTVLPPLQRRFSLPENSVGAVSLPVADPRRVRSTQRPFLTATSSLSPSRKTRCSSQPIDLAAQFSLVPQLEVNAALVRFEDGLRFALARGVVSKFIDPGLGGRHPSSPEGVPGRRASHLAGCQAGPGLSRIF